jgi:hypothetical protein
MWALCRFTWISGVPRNFVRGGGGVQQNHLKTEGRENGDLGAVTPSQGFRSICKWMKPTFLLGCFGYIFHRTKNSAQLCQNFRIWGGWGLNPPNSLSVRHWHGYRHLVTWLLYRPPEAFLPDWGVDRIRDFVSLKHWPYSCLRTMK